jgi:hypothetical protein
MKWAIKDLSEDTVQYQWLTPYGEWGPKGERRVFGNLNRAMSVCGQLRRMYRRVQGDAVTSCNIKVMRVKEFVRAGDLDMQPRKVGSL